MATRPGPVLWNWLGSLCSAGLLAGYPEGLAALKDVARPRIPVCRGPARKCRQVPRNELTAGLLTGQRACALRIASASAALIGWYRSDTLSCEVSSWQAARCRFIAS